jgi:uncharacterized protein (DUF885 family)
MTDVAREEAGLERFDLEVEVVAPPGPGDPIHSPALHRAGWVAVAGALGLACGVASAAQARPSADERFLAHLQGAYERQLQANPSMATEEGGSEGSDRWESLGEVGAAAGAAAAQRELDRVRREFADAPLEPRARMQYRVFERSQELLLERYRWRNHLYPLNQITGPPIDIPQVLGAQKIETAADAEAWLRRVSATRDYLGGLVERLELQAKHGVYLPRSVYPIVAGQARGLRDGVPAVDGPGAEWSTPMLEDFTAKVAALPLPAPEKEALLARARAALVNDLRPAYGRVIETLDAHAARTPVDGGAWQLPEGDAFYAFLVRQYTTTDMTPAQVHELGLREVARTHREMAAIMAEVGYEGDLKGFMQQMKSDPRFYLADDEAGRAAYLARAREIVAAMQAKLPAAFLQPPPLPLEIRPTPDYRAAGAPSGFYTGGTADGRRPGVVSLNLTRLDTRPLYELETLLYHEAVPGHHLQISSILVDPAIPELRKVSRYWENSAFVEGWALYAERLGKELGFFRDPYADFGRLAAELWRATRLVVDSGLHYKRWTREEAIAYLDQNTPSPRASNESAVDRYLAVPGQATSFMVGMQHILAERERARQSLGEKFDLRQFHAVVLENGYVPLWAVSESVDRWLAGQSVAQPAQHQARTFRSSTASGRAPVSST